MSTIVIGTVPTGAFALEETFTQLPELTVECEQVLVCGDGVSLPFLWVTGSDQSVVYETLAADRCTESVIQVANFGDTGLYYVCWQPEVQSLLRTILGSTGVILQAGCSRSAWKFRIFYPSREAASALDVNHRNNEVDFTVTGVQSVDSDRTFWYGLTTKQYATLRMAWERGYFAVPRRIDIQELSREMDVSHQALSERLRRGQYALINNLFASAQEHVPVSAR